MPTSSGLPQVCVLLLALWPIPIAAQGTPADYERARSLRARTANQVFRANVRPRWLSDNTRFWYRNDLTDGRREFVVVDAERGERRPAFDASRLAESLAKGNRPRSAARPTAHRQPQLRGNARPRPPQRCGQALGMLAGDVHTARSRRKRRRPAVEHAGGTRPTAAIATHRRRDRDHVREPHDRHLELFWIDPEGQRRSYGTVAAGGRHEQHIHHCHIDFDGSHLVVLTEGDGTHAIDYSPDGRYLIDTYSRVDLPPVTELRRVEDGKLVCELERADWSELLSTGWQVPERFVAKGRDGKSDIHGVIWRPTTFEAAKKYPVIEHIYAGPQSAFVPKRFQPLHRPQEIAELGFVVVQIDSMGTSQRSKAFHDEPP